MNGVGVLFAGLSLFLAGCDSPIRARSESELRASIARSLDRELAEAGADVEPLLTTRDEGGLERLELREDLLEEVERDYNPDRYFLEEGELEAEAPERRVSQIDELVGKDLLGRDQRVVSLGLQRAIRSAVANNLTTQAARLTPAIAEASVVEAEAAFDWVFTTSVAWQDTDTPGSGAGFLGLDETVQASQSINSTTSLRRPLTTGGELSIAQEFVYSDIRSSGFGPLPSPNPGSTASYTIGIDQPLLRGFGSDVALAQVRLARNEERRQIAALKTTLLDLVTSTENAYWDLVASHRELIISARVLERGETVRDEIKVRRVLDAIQAQVADAVATTERRRGELITARRELRRASDALKRLMNDPELPVGSEIMLIPADDGVDEPIRYSLVDAIRTASNERPELDSAVLDIDDASIGTVVAANNRLPSLDLRAEVTLISFDENLGNAISDLDETEFLDEFLLGAVFEQPIGNRAAEAGYRRARLQRMLSVVSYRDTLQGIVLEIKDAIDDLVTSYELAEQARISRIAAGEALRSLQVEKRLTERGFTVERLDVELNTQDALAEAERTEVFALLAYNRSIAALHRAMGTSLQRNRIDFVVPDTNQVLEGNSALDYRLGDDG